MTTIVDLLRARADDDATGLRFGDRQWTWREHVAASVRRARWLLDRWAQESADRPRHVGVLLDNTPEFSFWLSATALAGGVTVGLNATRGPAELVRDAGHTACQIVLIDASTDRRQAGALAAAGIPVVDVGDPALLAALSRLEPAPPDVAVTPGDLFMLIFTSGTTAAPKAVRCSHGRIAGSGGYLARTLPLGPDDVTYVAMPMFHSNAIIASWVPTLAVGGTLALRQRFSASGFLPDVRRYGVTYANYVGKALAYVLATPEHPDDANNPLRVVFGNEASDRDITRFGQRFGCRVIDGFGSTEGGISLSRTEDTPPGSLGRPNGDVRIIDPATGRECPPARFDDDGQVVNLDEAVGEMVNADGAGGFEGYWANPEADAQRMRDGRYHSGDLAYRAPDGFFYFAGRTSEWLRVDGENLAIAPIERVLNQHPDVVQAVAYAVADPDGVGDQLMAALELRPDATFDPAGFLAWLRTCPDLGTKAVPRFVRIVAELPRTATHKIRKRDLTAAAWDAPDVWWLPHPDLDAYRPMIPADLRS